MITIAKTVIGYIFSCKHVSVFFEDFEFNAIFIPMNLEKICSQAKVDSKLMQVLFDGSILGFNLTQVLVQNLLQQNCSTPL